MDMFTLLAGKLLSCTCMQLRIGCRHWCTPSHHLCTMRLLCHNSQWCRLLSSKRFTPKTAAQENEDTGPDVITKIFGAIFGKGALEERKPMGMQRMSEESMHELYPATTTEFADPVSTDDKEMALFRGLLAKTRIASLPLRYGQSIGYRTV